jgi:phospholipid transport system substrate-binding protein
LGTILQESVGVTWQSLPPDQQAQLLKSFRRYTIPSYINSFDEYNGQRFVVNPETRVVGDEQVVRGQIIPLSGGGHELDYLMREGPAGWRVADVLADGAISRVAVQRSDFRQMIKQGGAPVLAQELGSQVEPSGELKCNPSRASGRDTVAERGRDGGAAAVIRGPPPSP